MTFLTIFGKNDTKYKIQNQMLEECFWAWTWQASLRPQSRKVGNSKHFKHSVAGNGFTHSTLQQRISVDNEEKRRSDSETRELPPWSWKQNLVHQTCMFRIMNPLQWYLKAKNELYFTERYLTKWIYLRDGARIIALYALDDIFDNFW